MASDELGERSEPPTARRRAESRREGNVAKSQELGGALMLAAGTLLIAVLGPRILASYKIVLAAVLSDDMLGSPLAVSEAVTVAAYVAINGGRLALPILLLMVLAAFVFQYIQVGWLVTLNVRTETLRAFEEAEYRKLIAELPS